MAIAKLLEYTPLKPRHGNFQQWGQYRLEAAALQREHAKDMIGHWIGPYQPQHFMTELMDISPDDLAKMPKDVKFDLPTRKHPKARIERNLYQAFVSTMLASLALPHS